MKKLWLKKIKVLSLPSLIASLLARFIHDQKLSDRECRPHQDLHSLC